jgi:hypothetical protein
MRAMVCIAFLLLLAPALAAVQIETAPVPTGLSSHEIAERACRSIKADDLIGKTRAEIAPRLQSDGGINGIYKGERFVFLKDGHPLSFSIDGFPTMQCKLEIDFRPRGISNEA